MDSTDRYGLEAQFRFIHNDALKGINSVGRQLDVLMRQMDDLEDVSRSTSTTFDRSMQQINRGGTAVATKQAEKLSKQLDKVKQTLSPIRDEFRAIKAEARNIDFGDLADPKQFKQGKKAIDRYITSLVALERQVTGNSASERVLTASIKNQQRAARSRMEAIEAERAALNAAQKQGTSALAAGAGAAIVAPIASFTKDAVTVFADFDERMAKVAAATEATGSDLLMLRERAKELGANTKYSSSEAADAMKYLAMAGLKTGEIYTAVADALQLASAGELDLAEAADITTKVMAGMGMKVDELTHITDVLGRTATATNTSVQGLGMALGYSAPPAKAFGARIEEVTAMIGAMANSGIDASSAGTAMRSVFTRLAKPPKLAAEALAKYNVQVTSLKTGATRNILDVMTEIGSKLGMNAEDVSRTKKFLKDAAAAGGDINAAIDDEIAKGGRNADQLGALKDIFGAEAMSGAAAVISNIQQTKQNTLTNLASTFDPKAMKAIVASLGQSIPELQKLYELANSNNFADRQKFEKLDLSKFLVENVTEYGDQVKYIQSAKEALTKDSAEKINGSELAKIQLSLETRKGEDEDFARRFANVDFTKIEGGAATYDALAKGIGNADLAIGIFNTTARNNKVALVNTMSTAEKMAKVMDDNLGGAFKNLDSARESFMLNFIEPLAPAIRFAVEALTNFLSFLANLPTPIRTIIGLGGALTAFMGVLLLAGGSLGVLVFGFQQSAATASIAISTLERGIVPLTGFYQTAMLAAAGTGPFNGRLAAMTALAKQTIVPLDRASASMSKFGNTAKLALFSPLGSTILVVGGLMLAIDALMPQLNLFGQIFSAIAAPIGFVWGLLKGFTNGLLELLNPIVATTSAIAGFPFANIGEGLQMAIAAFHNFAAQGEAIGKLAANFLSMPLIMAANWIAGAWELAIGTIRAGLSGFIAFVDLVRVTVINLLNHSPTVQIPLAWQNAISTMQGYLAVFLISAQSLGTNLINTFASAASSIRSILASIFTAGSLWDGIKAAGTILGGIVRGWGVGIAGFLGGVVFVGIRAAMWESVSAINSLFFQQLLPVLEQRVKRGFGRTAASVGLYFSAVLGAILLKSSVTVSIIAYAHHISRQLTEALAGASSQIQVKWEGTIDWIMNCLSRFVSFAEGIGTTLISALAKNSPGPLYWIELKWQSAIEFIQGLLTGFQTKASEIGANITGVFSAAATTLSNTFAPAIDTLGRLFDQLSTKFNFGERFGQYLDTKFQLAATIEKFQGLGAQNGVGGNLIDVAGFKANIAQIGEAITYLLKVLIPVGLTEFAAALPRAVTLIGDTLLKGIAGIDRKKIEAQASETIISKGGAWGKSIAQAGYRLVEVYRQASDIGNLASANRQNLVQQYQETIAGTTNLAKQQSAQFQYYFGLADTYLQQFGEYVRVTVAAILSVVISAFDVTAESIIGFGKIIAATLTGAAFLSAKYFLAIPALIAAAWTQIWQMLERMNLADWARARGAEIAAAFTPNFTFAPTIDGRGVLDVSATIEDALTSLGSVATHLLDPFVNFNDTLHVLHSTMGVISKGISENIDLFNLLLLVVSTMPLGLASGGFLGKLPGMMFAGGAGGGKGMDATLAIKPLYRALALMAPAIVGTLVSSGLGASIPAAIISLIGVGLASNATTKVGKLFATTLAAGAMLQIHNLAPVIYHAFTEALGGFLDWEGFLPRATFDTYLAKAEAFVGGYYNIFDRAKNEAISSAKSELDGLPQLDALQSGLLDIKVVISGIYSALDAVKINIGGFDLSLVDLLGIDIAIKALQGLKALIGTDEFSAFATGVRQALKAVYDITAGFGNVLFGSLTTLWAFSSQTFQNIATAARNILAPVFTFVGQQLLAAGIAVMSYLEQNFPQVHALLLRIWGIEQQVQKAVVSTVKAVGTVADEVAQEAVAVAEEASSAVVRFLMKLPFGEKFLVPLYTGAVWLGQNIGPLITKGIVAATTKLNELMTAFGIGRLKVLFASGIEGIRSIGMLLAGAGGFAGELVRDLGVAVSFMANFLKHYKSTIGFIEYGIRAITPIDLFVLFNPGTDSELKSVVIQKFKMLAGLSKVMRTGATLEEVVAAMGYLQKLRLFVPAILSYVGAIGLAALAIYPVIKSLARAFLDWLTSPKVLAGIKSILIGTIKYIGIAIIAYTTLFVTSWLTGLSLVGSAMVLGGIKLGLDFAGGFISVLPNVAEFILQMFVHLPGDLIRLVGKGFQALGWIFWGLLHPVQAFENTLWALKHPIESLRILFKELVPEWVFDWIDKKIAKIGNTIGQIVDPVKDAAGAVASYIGGAVGQSLNKVFTAIAKILDGTIDLGDAIKNVLATAIAAFATFTIATKLLGKNAFTVLGTLFKGLFSPIFTLFDKFARIARIFSAPFQLAKRSAHESRVEMEKYNLTLDRANVIVSKQKNTPLLGKAVQAGMGLYNKKVDPNAKLMDNDTIRRKEKGFSRREELIALDEQIRQMAAEKLFADGIRGEIKGRFGQRSYTEQQIAGMTDKIYNSSDDVRAAIERLGATQAARGENSAAYSKAAIESLKSRDVKRDGLLGMSYSSKTIAAEIKNLDKAGKLTELGFGASLQKLAATNNPATNEVLSGLNGELRSKFIEGEDLFSDDMVVRAKNVQLYLDGNSTAIRKLVGESNDVDPQSIDRRDIAMAMRNYSNYNGVVPPRDANPQEAAAYNQAIAKRVVQSQNGLYSPRTYDRWFEGLGRTGRLAMNLQPRDREFVEGELRNFNVNSFPAENQSFAKFFAPVPRDTEDLGADSSIDSALRRARALQSIALKSGAFQGDLDKIPASLSIPGDKMRIDQDFAASLSEYFKKIGSKNPLSFTALSRQYRSTFDLNGFDTVDGEPNAGDLGLLNRILTDRIGDRYSSYSEDTKHSSSMSRVYASSLLQDPRAFAAAIAESRSIDPRSSQFGRIVSEVEAIKLSLEQTIGKDLGLFRQVNAEMMTLNRSLQASGTNSIQLLRSIANLDEVSLAQLVKTGKLASSADVSAVERSAIESLFVKDRDNYERAKKLALLSGQSLTDGKGNSLDAETLLGGFAIESGNTIASIDDILKHGMMPTGADVTRSLSGVRGGDRIDFERYLPSTGKDSLGYYDSLRQARTSLVLGSIESGDNLNPLTSIVEKFKKAGGGAAVDGTPNNNFDAKTLSALSELERENGALGQFLNNATTQADYLKALESLGIEKPQKLAEKIVASTNGLVGGDARRLARVLIGTAILRQTIAKVKGATVGDDNLPFSDDALNINAAKSEFKSLFGLGNDSEYTFKAISQANSPQFQSLTTAATPGSSPLEAYLQSKYSDSIKRDSAQKTIESGNLDYLDPQALLDLARESKKNVAQLIRPDLFERLTPDQKRMAGAARKLTVNERLIAKGSSPNSALTDFQQVLGDSVKNEGDFNKILELLSKGKLYEIKNQELAAKIAEYLSTTNAKGARAIVELETELSDAASLYRAYYNLGGGIANSLLNENSASAVASKYRKMGDAGSEDKLLEQRRLDAIADDRVRKMQMLAIAKLKNPTDLLASNQLPQVTKADEFGNLLGKGSTTDRGMLGNISRFVNSKRINPNAGLRDFVSTNDSLVKEVLGISFNQLDRIDDLDLRQILPDYDRVEKLYQRLSLANKYPDARFPELQSKLPGLLQGVNYPFKLKQKVDPKQRTMGLANLMMPDRQIVQAAPGQTADNLLGKDVKQLMSDRGIDLPAGAAPTQIYTSLKEGLAISTEDLTKTVESIYVDRARLKETIESDEKNAIESLLRLQSYARKIAAGKNTNANLAKLLTTYRQIEVSSKQDDKFYQSFAQVKSQIDEVLAGGNISKRLPEFFAGQVPVDLTKVKNQGLAIPELLNALSGDFYNTDLDKFARSLQAGTVDSFNLDKIKPLLMQLSGDRGQSILDALSDANGGLSADNQRTVYNQLGLGDPKFALDPRILAAKQSIAAGDYSTIDGLSEYLKNGTNIDTGGAKLVSAIDGQGGKTEFSNARQKDLFKATEAANQFAKSNQVYREIYENLAAQGGDRVELLAADLQELFGRVIVEATQEGKPIAIPPAILTEVKKIAGEVNVSTNQVEEILQKVLSGQYREIAEFSTQEQKLLRGLIDRLDLTEGQLLRLETAPTNMLGRILNAPGALARQARKSYAGFQEIQNATLVSISRRMGMGYEDMAKMLEFEGLNPDQIAKFFDAPQNNIARRKSQIEQSRFKLTEQLRDTAGLETAQINEIFQQVDKSGGSAGDREDLLKNLVQQALTARGRELPDVMRTMQLLDRGGMSLSKSELTRLESQLRAKGLDEDDIAAEIKRRTKSNQFATAAIGVEKLSDYLGTTKAQTESLAQLFGLQLKTLENLYSTRSPLENAARAVIGGFKQALSPAGLVKASAALAAAMGMRASARRLERTAADMQERQDRPKLPMVERIGKGIEENLVRPLLGSLARTYQQPMISVLGGISQVTGKLGDAININAAGRIWGMKALSSGLHKLEADLNTDINDIKNNLNELPGIKKNLRAAYDRSIVKKIVDFTRNIKLPERQQAPDIASDLPTALENAPLPLRMVRGILRNPLTAMMSGVSQALGDKLVEMAQEIRDNTIATLVVDTSTARGSAPQLKSEIRSVRAFAIERMGMFFRGLADPIGSAFNLYDKITDFGAIGLPKIIAKFRQLKANLLDGSAIEKAKGKIVNAAIAIYAAVGDSLTKIRDTIVSVTTKIWSSLKSVVGAIGSRIKGLFDRSTIPAGARRAPRIGKMQGPMRAPVVTAAPSTDPVQGPARPGRSLMGWREFLSAGVNRSAGEVPRAYRDPVSSIAPPPPVSIPDPWTDSTPVAPQIPHNVGATHYPIPADPWVDNTPASVAQPHVDPNPAIAAVNAIDTKMAAVNRDIEDNWNHTEDKVIYNIKNVAFAAKKLGYWIMRYLSEGSPGPTYYIRENYAETANFAVVKMRQMVAAAKLAGSAIQASLAGKDATKHVGKFNRLQANIFAHTPGAKKTVSAVDGLDAAMAEVKAHSQQSAHHTDRMARSTHATAVAATQTATQMGAATANTTRFGAVIDRVRSRMGELRAMAARITIGGGMRTTLKGAALMGGGVGAAFMGLQTLGDAGSQMGVLNEAAQQSMYKVMGLLQAFGAIAAIGGGAVSAIGAIATAIVGLSTAAVGLLINPITWYIGGFIAAILLLNEVIKVFTGFDVLGTGLSQIGLDGDTVSRSLGSIGESVQNSLAPALKWTTENVLKPLREAMVSTFGADKVAGFERSIGSLSAVAIGGFGALGDSGVKVGYFLSRVWELVLSGIVKVRDFLVGFTGGDFNPETGTILDNTPGPVKKIKLWYRFLTFFRNAWGVIARSGRTFFMQLIGNKIINRVRQMQNWFGGIGSTLASAAIWVQNAWGSAIDWIQAKFVGFITFIDGIRVAAINLLNHSPTEQIPLAWEGAIARMQSALEGFLAPAAWVASQLTQMFANPFGDIGKTFENIKSSLFGEAKAETVPPVSTPSGRKLPAAPVGSIAGKAIPPASPVASIASAANGLWQGVTGWFGGFNKPEVAIPDSAATVKAIDASKSVAARATDISARPGDKLLSDKAIERVPVLQATAKDLDAQIAKRRELAKIQQKAQNPNFFDKLTGAAEKNKVAIAAQINEFEKSLKLTTDSAKSQLGNDTANSIVSKLGIDPDGLMQAGGDISQATIGKITAAADEMGMAFNDAFTYFDDVGHLTGLATIAERALYQVGEGFDTVGKAFGDFGTEAFDAIKKMDLQGLVTAGKHFAETMKLGLGQIVNGFKEAAFNAVAFALWMVGATTPVSLFFVVLGVTVLYLTIRFEEFRQIFPGIINVIVGFAKVAIAAVKAIVGAIEGLLAIFSGIPDALTGDFTKINLGVIKIQETFDRFFISFGDGWEQMKKGFGQIGSALEAVYYGAIVTTFESIKLQLESLGRAFEGGLDGMGEYWVKVWSYWSGLAGDKLNEITAKLWVFANNAFEPIVARAQEFAQTIRTVLAEAITRISSLAVELTAEWQPRLEAISNLVYRTVEKIGDFIESIANRILAIPAAIANAFNALAGNAPDSIGQIFDTYNLSLSGFVDNLGGTIVAGFAGSKELLVANVHSTIAELTGIFTGAGEAIANTFNSAFERIEQRWQNTTGFVTNLFGRLKGKSAETGQEMLHNLAENSPGPTAQIRDRYSETTDHVVDRLDRMASAAADTGAKIDKSFKLAGAISSTKQVTGLMSGLVKTVGGETLAKPFEVVDGALGMANQVTTVADSLEGFSSVRDTFPTIAAGVNWLGTGLSLLGPIATSVVSAIGASFAWLGTTMGAMGAAASAAWSAVIAPILPIIIVVGLLVGALVWLGNVMYSNNFLGFADFIDALGAGFGEIIDSVFGTIGQTFSEIFNTIGSLVGSLLAPFEFLGSAIQSVFTAFGGGTQEISVLSLLAKGLIDTILAPFRVIGFLLNVIVTGIGLLLKGIIFLGGVVWRTLLAPFVVISWVFGSILKSFSLFIDAVKFLGSIVVGFILAPFQAIVGVIQFIASIIGTILQPIMGLIGGPLGSIATMFFGSNQSVTPTQEVKAYATGGYVRGPGGPTEDRVPALLSNGEFVVSAGPTSRNHSFLEAINNGADVESAISLLDVAHPISKFVDAAPSSNKVSEPSKSSDRPITVQFNFGDIILTNGSREEAEKVKEYVLTSLQSPEARDAIGRALRDEVEMMR